MISLIWAMDENRAIGYKNELPWRLPEDLKFFKKMTMGKPVIMGRRTFESIGKPLPGRKNIILTRQEHLEIEGCMIIHDLKELEDQSDEEQMIIGGAEIFKETLPLANRLYITQIYHSFEADTYFPAFDLGEWELVSKELGVRDEKNPYDYEFFIYDRKK